MVLAPAPVMWPSLAALGLAGVRAPVIKKRAPPPTAAGAFERHRIRRSAPCSGVQSPRHSGAQSAGTASPGWESPRDVSAELSHAHGHAGASAGVGLSAAAPAASVRDAPELLERTAVAKAAAEALLRQMPPPPADGQFETLKGKGKEPARGGLLWTAVGGEAGVYDYALTLTQSGGSSVGTSTAAPSLLSASVLSTATTATAAPSSIASSVASGPGRLAGGWFGWASRGPSARREGEGLSLSARAARDTPPPVPPEARTAPQSPRPPPPAASTSAPVAAAAAAVPPPPVAEASARRPSTSRGVDAALQAMGPPLLRTRLSKSDLEASARAASSSSKRHVGRVSDKEATTWLLSMSGGMPYRPHVLAAYGTVKAAFDSRP